MNVPFVPPRGTQITSLLLSALASTLVACVDAPTGTTAIPPCAFASTKTPSTSGPNVVRTAFAPGVLFAPDGELAVAVGFLEPFSDHCADVESPGQPGSTQTVFTPPGGIHVKQFGQDLSVVVYEFQGAVEDYCQDLVGAPVFATGTAKLTLTSNDIVFGGAGPGADQVHVTIHGIVDLTD